MNKLTAEKCRDMIHDMNIKRQVNGLSIREDRYFEALEIALPILEQQEQGEGEWIELGEGAIPVHPETLVEIKMRNGVTDGPRKAGGFFWFKGNAVRDEMDCDIIAYRIIPEQPTNQNGEQ